MKRMGITACGSYDDAEVTRSLERLLAAAGGLEWVEPGMRIAVKTNLLSGSAPDRAVVTHPAVLAALCGMLTARGAIVTVGDSPGGPFTEGNLRRVYRLSGMEQVERAGARLNMDVGQRDASFSGGKVLRQLTCTSWLTDADAVISCCKLKTHAMMGMSANVKNLFGAIPGTMKPEYHFRFPDHRDFADMLVDINEYLRPRLYITDAVVGMEGNGPASGTPREIGALLAGTDPYGLDLLCAHIIGLAPGQVPTIVAAMERGLCGKEPDWPEISGDPKPFVMKDFQNIRQLRGIEFGDHMPGWLVPIGRLALQARPKANRKTCIGCAKCGKVCPAGAIAMVHKYPVIDTEKCIRCFCCQEFCPEGAMKVHRPLIARIMNPR